jgi:hypothetical protein
MKMERKVSAVVSQRKRAGRAMLVRGKMLERVANATHVLKNKRLL